MEEKQIVQVNPLGTSDLCVILGITKQRVSILVLGGEFPNSFRIGGSHAIPYGDVVAYIDSRIAKLEEKRRQLEGARRRLAERVPVSPEIVS